MWHVRVFDMVLYLTFKFFTFTSFVITLILMLAACLSSAYNFMPLRGVLPIEAPPSTMIGNEIEIMVGPVEADNGTPVGLIIVGAKGPHIYQAVFDSGVARFTIPASDTYQSGYAAVIVAAGEARGETSILFLGQGKSAHAHLTRMTSAISSHIVG